MGELADRALQTEQRQATNDEGTEGRWIRELWVKLLGIFGDAWYYQYGMGAEDGQRLTTTQKIWLRGLKGIPPERLAKGLEGCLDWKGRKPPNLPQFRELCEPEPASRREYKSLPNGIVCRETSKKAITKIKSTLAAGRTGAGDSDSVGREGEATGQGGNDSGS